jgi:hypothetical protein
MPPVPPAPDPAIAALQEAVRRCVRGGAARSVLLLHLSAPGLAQPRHAAYHARVARAVLTDVAHRLDGEVLRLANGDLALVCRRRAGTPDPIGPDGEGPDGLPAVLNRLFAITGVRDQDLFCRWQLPRDAASLQEQLALPPQAATPPPAAAPADPLGAVAALLDVSGLPTAMRRQTAVQLDPGGGMRRLRACFQEVTVSIAALETRIAAYGRAQSDPFVFRHVAARLDQPMMAALQHQLAAYPPRSPRDAAGRPVPVHINLALPGILSDALGDLVALCRAHGRRLGVEVSMIEAFADPALCNAAQQRLERLGVDLILDGVTAEALQMIRPGTLGAAMLKLDWTPSLARLAGLPRGRMIEALRAIGPDRLVLQHAETEAALVWGRANGIALFQGRHIDAMMAASRITVCAHAAGCTLRQCIDRAAAIEPSGRAGCRDFALLDAVATPESIAAR